jgi:hypothetical protein
VLAQFPETEFGQSGENPEFNPQISGSISI